MRGRARLRIRAAAVAMAVAALAGCGSGLTTHRDLGAAAQPAQATQAPTPPAGPVEPQFIDVAALPAGAPPGVDSLVGGVLRHRGRSAETDLPGGVFLVRILGVVGGRVVVTASLAGARPGERFWAVDADGHAERIGGVYQSYDYAPELVEGTGHVWVHHSDRTTPRTLWELDVRTGREVATYAEGRVPRGLAPADQALVDAWVQRRSAVPETEARTRSLRAVTRTVNPAAGVFGDSVVVKQVATGTVLGRFTFPSDEGGVDRVVLEDGSHVLALVTVSASRRGYEQAIVRCSLSDGTCERATDIGGSMALGVDRPRFAPRHRG